MNYQTSPSDNSPCLVRATALAQRIVKERYG